MFAILAGIVVAYFGVVWMFPAVPMSMGFEPGFTRAILGIPMLFVLCVMMWTARHIYYNEETFTFRNAFGIKRRYLYETITLITVRKRKLTVVADGRKKVFPVTYYGAREFASFVSNKSRV